MNMQISLVAAIERGFFVTLEEFAVQKWPMYYSMHVTLQLWICTQELRPWTERTCQRRDKLLWQHQLYLVIAQFIKTADKQMPSVDWRQLIKRRCNQEPSGVNDQLYVQVSLSFMYSRSVKSPTIFMPTALMNRSLTFDVTQFKSGRFDVPCATCASRLRTVSCQSSRSSSTAQLVPSTNSPYCCRVYFRLPILNCWTNCQPTLPTVSGVATCGEDWKISF